jgi:hypothetical protein
MGEVTKEDFFKRIEGAPAPVKDFFRAVETHFTNEGGVIVHHTQTGGGDMRVGIPAHLSKTGKVANFATLKWQPNRQAIVCCIYLTQEELSDLRNAGTELGEVTSGKLLSKFRLFEGDWATMIEDFGHYLEAAHIKMLAQN